MRCECATPVYRWDHLLCSTCGTIIVESPAGPSPTALLAEVERLRGEVAGVTASRDHLLTTMQRALQSTIASAKAAEKRAAEAEAECLAAEQLLRMLNDEDSTIDGEFAACAELERLIARRLAGKKEGGE